MPDELPENGWVRLAELILSDPGRQIVSILESVAKSLKEIEGSLLSISNSIRTAPIVPIKSDSDYLNHDVKELRFSVRSRKCLTRLGVSTIRDLTQVSPCDILECRNTGRTTLAEIQDKLTTIGLSLKSEIIPENSSVDADGVNQNGALGGSES